MQVFILRQGMGGEGVPYRPTVREVTLCIVGLYGILFAAVLSRSSRALGTLYISRPHVQGMESTSVICRASPSGVYSCLFVPEYMLAWAVISVLAWSIHCLLDDLRITYIYISIETYHYLQQAVHSPTGQHWYLR